MNVPMEHRLSVIDAGLLVLVAFIWGFNFVVIAFGLQGFPPLLFSALRFTICAFPAVLFVPRPPIGWRELIAIGVVLGTLVFAFLFVGIHLGMPAGLASLVMQMQVFFTVLLGLLLLNERPGALNWVALAIGSGGIAMIGVERTAHGGLGALMLVLGGALSWGIANILMKRLPKLKMMHLMVWMSLVPPLPLFLLSLPLEGWDTIRTAILATGWAGIGAVLYTGLLSTTVAYGIWGGMLQRYPTATVAPFALLTPIFGLLSAALFMGERYSMWEAIASGLVIAALAINFCAVPLGTRLKRVLARAGIMTELY